MRACDPVAVTVDATHSRTGATYGHGGLIQQVSLADGDVTVDHDPLRGQPG